MKLSKAIEKTGFLPSTQIEIMQTMQSDQYLTKRLTQNELSHIATLLDAHWKKAESHHNNQVDAEGCFWSETRNKLIEFD